MRLKPGMLLGAALCLAVVAGCGSGGGGNSSDNTGARYQVSDLGLTVGQSDTVVLDVNNGGDAVSLVHPYEDVPPAPFDPDVAGSAIDVTEPDFVVKLHRNGSASDLATRFDHSYSDTVRISSSGVVVGTSHSPGERWSAVTVAGGSVTKLSPLPGDVCSHGIAVNSLGHVAGWSSDGTAIHACLWKDGSVVNLGTLDSATKVKTTDMNDSDDVVGWAWSNAGVRSFLGHGGAMMDIGKLEGASGCYAESINNSEQIVGSCSFSSPSTTKAFIWQNGHMSALGTLGGQSTLAHCINNLGQVVGWSSTSDGPVHAFIWKDGHMVDLNSLLPAGSDWVLTDALAINDNGVIVGVGTHGGARRACILTPAN